MELAEQLDALIAEHGLRSINLTRIVRADGTNFWAIYAQDSGFCGTNGHVRGGTASEGLTAAIDDLNAKRYVVPAVPELGAA